MKRPSPLALSAVLLLALLLPGCGGASTSTAVHQAHAQKTHENIAGAMKACRNGASLASWLSKESRADLYDTCDAASNSGLSKIAQYAAQVCDEVAFTMPGSSGSAKKRVLEACAARTKDFAPSVR